MMLRNIDPIISPDLIHALAQMGHGDEIAIVDANFPGESTGPWCIRADAADTSMMLRAVLALLPLDDFVPDPAHTMQVVGEPDTIPPTQKDFQKIIDEHADNPAPIATIERFSFYERAAQAFVILQTGERRLYGNIILKKGVIR